MELAINALLGGLLGYGTATALGLPMWADWPVMSDAWDFTMIAAVLAWRFTPRGEHQERTEP